MSKLSKEPKDKRLFKDGEDRFLSAFFILGEEKEKPFFSQYVKNFFFDGFFAYKFNKNRKKPPPFFCINRIFLHKTLDKPP